MLSTKQVGHITNQVCRQNIQCVTKQNKYKNRECQWCNQGVVNREVIVHGIVDKSDNSLHEVLGTCWCTFNDSAFEPDTKTDQQRCDGYGKDHCIYMNLHERVTFIYYVRPVL